MNSFLDLVDENLSEVEEPKAVEEGEYTIRIVDWKTAKDGKVIIMDVNDHPYLMPIFEVIECEEAELAKSFTHFLRLPSKDQSAKDCHKAKWDLKVFGECFGIDYSQRVDFEACIGLTGDALLYVAEDTGYGEQNKVRKFLTPR